MTGDNFTSNSLISSRNRELLAEDGNTILEVHLDHETVWLSQDQMVELFVRERSVITKHLRNVFKESELEESAVRAKNAHTALDGKTYQAQFYYLDAILSVGYRLLEREIQCHS